MIEQGAARVWFDRRSHHLVVFDGALEAPGWAHALAGLVSSGREQSVEVRKVDGGEIPDEVRQQLIDAGFVDGYRGLTKR